MKTSTILISRIKVAPYNPRVDLKPGDRDYEKIKRSLTEFGLVEPLVWNEHNGVLVGGHQRLKVLKDLGHKDVVVSVVNIADEQREKALNIALNKVQGRFDDEKIAALLTELNTAYFDVSVSGFSESDIHKLLGSIGQTGGKDPDAAPPKQHKPVTKTGDVWVLGDHLVMCGDCTNPKDVDRLFKKETGVLMNTDPPYGINYVDVAASSRGAKKGKDIENDTLDGAALQKFLEATLLCALPKLRINTAFYLWHPMLTQGKFFEAAAAAAGILIHRQIIWVKPSLIMGRGDYHWRHELCFYGWIQGNRPPWKSGRDQDTVWEVGRENDRIHPTQKPVDLFTRPIMNHTDRGEIIYEPFAGSGSQIIAAQMTGRRCFAMEIDPGYIDVCVQRWQTFTGGKAKRA